MRLIERAKNICLSPRGEWDAITAEPTSLPTIVVSYMLPLAALAAAADFVGDSVLGLGRLFGSGRTAAGWGLALAAYQIVMAVVAVLALAFIVDALAPLFR